MITRIAGNWQTSIIGMGVLVMTIGKWFSGEVSLSADDIMQLLIAAGFLGSKDATTGSAPSS